MRFSTVEHVEIKGSGEQEGEKIPVCFNMMALHRGQKESGVSIMEIQTRFEQQDFTAGFAAIPYFWNATVIAHKILNIDNPFSEAEFKMMDYQYLMPFLTVMMESISKMDNTKKKQVKEIGTANKSKKEKA